MPVKEGRDSEVKGRQFKRLMAACLTAAMVLTGTGRPGRQPGGARMTEDGSIREKTTAGRQTAGYRTTGIGII